MSRPQTDRLFPWLIGLSAAAGVSAAAFTVFRFKRRRRDAATGPYAAMEDAAIDALLRDPLTSKCAIEVAALGPGIIELTGSVPTVDVSQRAARTLHALEGVRTVVNRLQTGSLEERLAENRLRRAEGEPRLRDRRWYGGHVGMGRPRQSPETDPDRPDDMAERLADELDVTSADVAEATTTERGSTDTDALRH